MKTEYAVLANNYVKIFVKSFIEKLEKRLNLALSYINMPVYVKELLVKSNEQGDFTEILKSNDPLFTKFGQVYTSSILPNVVKGFHKHKFQVSNITCLLGAIKLVTIDDKTEEIKEFYLNTIKPKLITIEPCTWYGWQCFCIEKSLLLNISSELHTPENSEFENALTNKWGYKW